jgi:hypothetical protein
VLLLYWSISEFYAFNHISLAITATYNWVSVAWALEIFPSPHFQSDMKLHHAYFTSHSVLEYMQPLSPSFLYDFKYKFYAHLTSSVVKLVAKFMMKLLCPSPSLFLITMKKQFFRKAKCGFHFEQCINLFGLNKGWLTLTHTHLMSVIHTVDSGYNIIIYKILLFINLRNADIKNSGIQKRRQFLLSLMSFIESNSSNLSSSKYFIGKLNL